MVEHLRVEQGQGHFAPTARLLLTGSLRTSGLLGSLSDADARSLLALLTFLTPNGRIWPTTVELSSVLRLPEQTVGKRMHRLAAFRWRGEAIVREVEHGSRSIGYMPSRHLVGEWEAVSAPSETAPPYQPAGREAVVAYSRAAFARPRAEVEQLVAAQLGHAPEEAADTPEGEVRRQLAALGVPRDVADLLIAQHSIEEIRQQLEWLPHRGAKTPGRFIVAAIQNRYEPPARVRLEQALAAEQAEEARATRTVEAGGETAPAWDETQLTVPEPIEGEDSEGREDA